MIKFFSALDWVEQDYPIVNADKHLPTWIKCMSSHGPYDPNNKFQESYVKATTSTIKNCFGVRNLFKRAFIVPMWTDSWMELDKKTNEMWSRQPGMVEDAGKKLTRPPSTTLFPGYMMVDWLPPVAKAANPMMFKFDNIWYVESSTHDLLQVPLFYHYNEDFSCTMGVIPVPNNGTQQININLILKKDKVHIKAGTPVVMLVPIPKEERVPSQVGTKFKEKSLKKFEEFALKKTRQLHPNQYLKAMKKDKK